MTIWRRLRNSHVTTCGSHFTNTLLKGIVRITVFSLMCNEKRSAACLYFSGLHLVFLHASDLQTLRGEKTARDGRDSFFLFFQLIKVNIGTSTCILKRKRKELSKQR